MTEKKQPYRIFGFTWVEFYMLLLGAITLIVEIIAFITMKDSTISVVMRHDGQRWLWEPFLFGLLTGHFYTPDINWRRFGWASRPWPFPVAWIVIAAAIVARDTFIGSWVSLWWAFSAAILGLVCGGILWNQGD